MERESRMILAVSASVDSWVSGSPLRKSTACLKAGLATS